MRAPIIALILLVAALPRAGLAQPQFEPVSRAIQALVDSGELPSAAAAVADRGRIVWEGGWGWADRERRVPATARTPYSLASVSKPFTATAVMQLVESGQVALDRPANDYLGPAGITGRDAARATVRRILSHTAGLPAYYRPFFPGPAPPIEQLIARDARLTGRPGQYRYSNLGYGILEHIIARTSGSTYDEYLRRAVFEPLGLESASVPIAPPADAAVRYGTDNQPLPFYDVGHRGASSVFASARDVARFGMLHLKGLDGATVVLTRRSIDAMQRVECRPSAAYGYGLGWRILDEDGPLRRVEHTGGMPGVTTVLTLFPSERTVIVVLANRRSNAVLRLADRLAAAAIPRYAWELRRSGRFDRTTDVTR